MKIFKPQGFDEALIWFFPMLFLLPTTHSMPFFFSWGCFDLASPFFFPQSPFLPLFSLMCISGSGLWSALEMGFHDFSFPLVDGNWSQDGRAISNYCSGQWSCCCVCHGWVLISFPATLFLALSITVKENIAHNETQ